jgi:hypothetical protein
VTNSRCVVFTNSEKLQKQVQSAFKFVLQKSRFFKAAAEKLKLFGSASAF